MNVWHGLLSFSVVGALSLFAAGGCGETTSGIEGISCTQDSDCNSGLKCLPYEGFTDGGGGNDAGCASSGSECLAPCTTNADCTAAGPGLICFASCGAGTCEAPGVLGVPPLSAEAGPEAGSEASVEAGPEAASEASTDAGAEAASDAPTDAPGDTAAE